MSIFEGSLSVFQDWEHLWEIRPVTGTWRAPYNYRFNFRQALHTVATRISRILMLFFFSHTFPRYIPLPSYYTFHSVYFLISFVHFLFHSCSNCTDRGGVIGCCEIKIDANTYRISELSLEMQLIPKFERVTFGHVHPMSRSHTIVLFLTYLSS